MPEVVGSLSPELVHLARHEMTILPTAATLSLSADEFLPHNPRLSLWASEGIVFVYSQAFFHQENTRQCEEREREMEKSGSYLGNGEKVKYYYANVAGQQDQCVCVCV